MLYGVCTGTGRESPYVPAFFCIEQVDRISDEPLKAHDFAGNSGGRGKVRTCDPTRVKADGECTEEADLTSKSSAVRLELYPNCTGQA